MPFPTAEAVNLEPPDAEEVVLLSRGILGVIAADRSPSQLQSLLAEALVPAMTGFPFAATEAPISPGELAQALAGRDEAFRTRILQVVSLLLLVLRPVPADGVNRARKLATELGVDEGMLTVAQEFAAGSLGLAAFDFDRSGPGSPGSTARPYRRAGTSLVSWSGVASSAQ